MLRRCRTCGARGLSIRAYNGPLSWGLRFFPLATPLLASTRSGLARSLNTAAPSGGDDAVASSDLAHLSRRQAIVPATEAGWFDSLMGRVALLTLLQ
jgi:hypothetical protein